MKWVVTLAVLAVGCDYVERPRRPIPEHFSAETLAGEPIDRDSLKGKPWVVNIWVPGCGICAREFPDLEALRRKYEEKGVGFLALSIEPDAQLVLAASQRLNIGAKVAIAKSETLAPFGVNQVPSTVFLRADGVLNAVVSGPKDRAWFERRIEEILQ